MITTAPPDRQTPVLAESREAAYGLRSIDMLAEIERLNQSCARAQCLVQCLGSALAARELGEPG